MGKRLGCGKKAWEIYVNTKRGRRFLDELYVAQDQFRKGGKLSAYDSAEALTGLPPGYEAL